MSANPQTNLIRNKDRAALEDIAHLTKRICLIWGTAELDTFLSRLLMDARDGDRQGLPVAVATEILFLAQTNKMVRAVDLTKQLNINLKEAYKLVDTGDQARLGADALDDPLVSRDTITRTRRPTGVFPQSSAIVDAGSQAEGLGQLLMMLIRSKWLVWAVVLVLGAKFVWPAVRALI